MKKSELENMTGAEMINALENIGGSVTAAVRKNLVADKDSAKKSFIRRYGRMLVDEEEELTPEEQEKKMWDDKIAEFNRLGEKVEVTLDDYSYNGVDITELIGYSKVDIKRDREHRNAEILAISAKMRTLYDELFAHFYEIAEKEWNYLFAEKDTEITVRGYFCKSGYSKFAYMSDTEIEKWLENYDNPVKKRI